MHDGAILSQAAPVREWRPALPSGSLRAVVLHWTAGDYATVFPAYHFCLSGAADIFVTNTHDLRANMRDVRTAPAQAYAAHTQGRNSYAAGLAICAMQAATPQDFGAYPLTEHQIEALCLVAATLVRFYGIALGAVVTHAEAALADGYFGARSDDVRWDIARLEARPEPLLPAEARHAGDQLRSRIGQLV